MHDEDSTAEGMWARLRQQSFVQSLLLAIQVCAALLYVARVTHPCMCIMLPVFLFLVQSLTANISRLQQAKDRVRSNTSRALRAIDWPEASESSASGKAVHQAHANDRCVMKCTCRNHVCQAPMMCSGWFRQPNGSTQAEAGEGHKQAHRLAKWLQQIKLFRLAAQDLSESLWQVKAQAAGKVMHDMRQSLLSRLPMCDHLIVLR